MSKAQYDIYLRKVMDLAKTLVVKSQASADAINAGLKELGWSVNDADPTSWKYYLNLAGRYHASDRLMTVTSLDTLQTIDFTRENLLQHRSTLREYAFGSRYYNELVSRFPEQENLIRGILNPVEMATAVAAQDGEILYYQEDLVEENETNLIPQLNDWTKGFMVRWHVRAYTLTDDLYAGAQLAILYMNLPAVIMNLRLANCHTQYAHSFHIQAYLASHGRLDVYLDSLTKKQMLWLYRNIRYIHRNAGKQHTFEWLVQNVLTDRGLPLAEWNMRHNLKDQVTEIYPEVEFVRKPLNFGYNSAGVDTRGVEEMLDAEQPIAKGNIRVQQEAEGAIATQMVNSLNDQLRTKVLESSILDMTDATPYTLSDALLNHWLYFATIDSYKAVMVIDNPKSGGTLTLTMREAFIVFLYAYNLARGVTLIDIPALEAIHVRRPTPARSVLESVVDPKIVSSEIVDEAMRDIAPLTIYISAPAFHDAVLSIHSRLLEHRELYATRQHYVERGQVEQMVSRLYCDYPCRLGEGVAYTDWFEEHGLNIPTFNALEADLLANEILAHATGTNLKASQSLKEMQAAMLRLMGQLSSYSVQYLQSINRNPIKVVDWPAIRPGDDTTSAKDDVMVNMIDLYVEDMNAHGAVLDDLSLDEIGNEYEVNAKFRHQVQVPSLLDCTIAQGTEYRVRLLHGTIGVLAIHETIDKLGPDTPDTDTDAYQGRETAPLSTAFNSTLSNAYSLDAAAITQLQGRWSHYIAQHGDPRTTLSSLMGSILPGFEYPEL